MTAIPDSPAAAVLADVDVVMARLSDYPDLTPFDALLSDEERSRAIGFKVAAACLVFTLARGLLRAELARRLRVTAAELRFDLRPSGKPDLRPGPTDRPDWRFSVSHTGPEIALAFARDADVGIDIERTDRAIRPLEIARRYFAPAEVRSLEGFGEGSRRAAFFAGWTRKEAIVKARGQTMAESLATLTVDLNPLATHPSYEDDPSVAGRAVCRLAAFEIPERSLQGAVALQSDRVPRLTFHTSTQVIPE